MVMMSLSLEVVPGISDSFYSIEPKLRDRFLQVLFDHANTGGFGGNFTNSDNLSVLRKSLLNVARKEMGDGVTKVLITSVNRQDTWRAGRGRSEDRNESGHRTARPLF